MSAEKFGALLRQRFPELRAEVDDGISTGLVHLEMSALRRLAEGAIEQRDEGTLKLCYELAGQALLAGTPDLQTAVSVSFVEDLLLYVDEDAKWAEALLPAGLKADLESTRAGYEAPDHGKDGA